MWKSSPSIETTAILLTDLNPHTSGTTGTGTVVQAANTMAAKCASRFLIRRISSSPQNSFVVALPQPRLVVAPRLLGGAALEARLGHRLHLGGKHGAPGAALF